jgi:sterol desaturase/sphingolipid hydroxylase (fatty acid hydroxylase superfamily)
MTMSLAQTVMHRYFGHRAWGGKFYRNHVDFHHAYYARDHLASAIYLGDAGNNTPYFLIPVCMVGACAYFLLPLHLFVVAALACAASFYAHVLFDKEYHVEDSMLLRFAWFRHMRKLHFVHHRHANTNFAVVDFYWDRLLGTYRGPDVERDAHRNLRPSAVTPRPPPTHRSAAAP